MERSRATWISLILRVVMGAWFLYAGGLKIFGTGLEQFVKDIGNYRLVEGNAAVAAAYLVPWLEVVAGLCFLPGYLMKGAWLAMLGLVGAFTFSVGSAWLRGLDISCGCLGGVEKISYWRKAIEFAVYFAALGWIGRTELWPGTAPLAKAG